MLKVTGFAAEFTEALSVSRLGTSFLLPSPIGDVFGMPPVPASPETCVDSFQGEESR